MHLFCLAHSNNCCADCCRDKKNSVCRAHGTGYLAAEAAVESATHQGFLEFDMRYVQKQVALSEIFIFFKAILFHF